MAENNIKWGFGNENGRFWTKKCAPQDGLADHGMCTKESFPNWGLIRDFDTRSPNYYHVHNNQLWKDPREIGQNGTKNEVKNTK